MRNKFLEFASRIYAERHGPPGKPPFWLPALYGGESLNGFFAAVVLEQPSEWFMEKSKGKFWNPPPSSVADAVATHRRILFDWAKKFPQAELFQILINLSNKLPALSSKGLRDLTMDRSFEDEFFRRLYITDNWKDCLPDRDYWDVVLQGELANIQAEMILLVGTKARRQRKLCPSNMRVEDCMFPSPRNRHWTRRYVQELAHRLENAVVNGTPRVPSRSEGSSHIARRTKFEKVCPRTWTLNAKLGYYVATGLRDRTIDLCLQFKNIHGIVTPIGRYHLNLELLAEKGIVARRKMGTVSVFDVRIVRDPKGSCWLGVRTYPRLDLET